MKLKDKIALALVMGRTSGIGVETAKRFQKEDATAIVKGTDSTKQPLDIARTARYLASDNASFVTDTELVTTVDSHSSKDVAPHERFG